MKLIHVLILPILLITFNLNAQVKVDIRNTTGSTLESVIVNDIELGTIENNENVVFTLLSVQVADNSPELSISAIFGGETLSTGNSFSYCITSPPKIFTATEGEVNRDILVLKNKKGQNYISLSIGTPERWKASFK